MNTDPEQGGRIAMSIVMIALAFLGADIVACADDLPMSIFGYALILFGTLYTFGLVRQHYDAVERADSSPQVAAASVAVQPAKAA